MKFLLIFFLSFFNSINSKRSYFINIASDNNNNKKIKLCNVKDKNLYSLEENFLKQIQIFFDCETFIETGTYLGETVSRALPYFKKIHSIEISKDLYLKAKHKFKNNNEVELHLGDSAKALEKVLSKVNGKILLWLDAHSSDTKEASKGNCNASLIEELRAIAHSKIKDPIILIDDLRHLDDFLYSPQSSTLDNYPSINKIIIEIINISKDYCFAVLGDVLLAYSTKEKVNVSPIVKSCTISRLFNGENFLLNDLIKAEKIISKASGIEREAIGNLFNSFFNRSSSKHFGISNHYGLWEALILANANQTNQAQNILVELNKRGFKRWKLHQSLFNLI